MAEKINYESVGKWAELEPAPMSRKVRRNCLVPHYSMEHATETSCGGQEEQSNNSSLRL